MFVGKKCIVHRNVWTMTGYFLDFFKKFKTKLRNIGLHSEICLSFSRGTSVLKFRFEDFEDMYSEKVKDNNTVLHYGTIGNSKLIKHTQSMKPFVLKTVLYPIILPLKLFFEISKKFLNDIIPEEFKNYENFYSRIRDLKFHHILRTFHYNEDEKNVFLILECADNGSLKDLLVLNKKLSEDEAFAFFCQCCLALEYLHTKNICHGDFKVFNYKNLLKFLKKID